MAQLVERCVRNAQARVRVPLSPPYTNRASLWRPVYIISVRGLERAGKNSGSTKEHDSVFTSALNVI